MHRTRFAFTINCLTATTLVACDADSPRDDSEVAAHPVAALSVDADSNDAPDSLVARAQLRDGAGALAGEARLFLRGDAVIVHVEGAGLAPGDHGIHVHETGACDPLRDFESAGAHLNPNDVPHGLQAPAGGHAGDLPNLAVAADSTGSLRFEATGLAVGTRSGELFDRDGSALVIHTGPDDQLSDPSGNSGGRVACGVLERA